MEASKTNRWKHKTEIIYAHCYCDKSRRIIPCSVHLLKHWINMRNACHKIKFKPNDLVFIHITGKIFRYRCVGNSLVNLESTKMANFSHCFYYGMLIPSYANYHPITWIIGFNAFCKFLWPIYCFKFFVR